MLIPLLNRVLWVFKRSRKFSRVKIEHNLSFKMASLLTPEAKKLILKVDKKICSLVLEMSKGVPPKKILIPIIRPTEQKSLSEKYASFLYGGHQQSQIFNICPLLWEGIKIVCMNITLMLLSQCRPGDVSSPAPKVGTKWLSMSPIEILPERLSKQGTETKD